MKELAFKEVIANIKEEEVWESNYKRIYINSRGYIEVAYIDDGSSSCMMFPDYEKFKLQRQKVSFATAFKEYEEGKEIESCVSGCKYYKDDKKEYFKETDDAGWVKWTDGGSFDLNEIRGEWYINWY